MRLAWGRTLLLGTGFFAVSVIASFYDSYVPKFYEGFLQSSALVGLVMGIDNLLAWTVQPFISSLSDRTQTRLGRRLPFILVGMPIAAILVFLLPLGRELGLWPLLAATVLLNLCLVSFRSPVIALMPDLTPQEQRSQANGLINLMGGVGSVMAALLGSRLYGLSPRYPFWFGAAIFLVVTFIFARWIREPKQPEPVDSDEPKPAALLPTLGALFREPRRMGLMLFVAMAVYMTGYQAVNTWFTLWSEQQLGIPVNEAASKLSIVGLAFILMAVPAGFLGARLGRRLTMALGLGSMALVFLGIQFMGNASNLPLFLGATGIGWALVNINAYPLAVSLCGPSETGTYTGLYYIFTGIAGTFGPGIAGQVFDLAGSKQPLFPLGAAAMGLAMLLLLLWRERPAVSVGLLKAS
ncbi:MAG TPA: MFS transporter [Symbiobacteriaceae bacterium]|nr:MFS transporter [Symbiobacteriaceae bacterium]